MLDKGVYHWDIKPGNIWITTKGRTILFDFDLAFRSYDEFLDRQLNLAGTGRYMSAKRGVAHQLDPPIQPGHSDEIYALAVTMAELLADEDFAVRRDQRAALPDWVKGRGEIPEDIKAVLNRALSDKEEYKTIDEFIRDLEAIAAQRGIDASEEIRYPSASTKFGGTVASITGPETRTATLTEELQKLIAKLGIQWVEADKAVSDAPDPEAAAAPLVDLLAFLRDGVRNRKMCSYYAGNILFPWHQGIEHH